ncbi:MAG: hypothetical protein AAGA64_15020 [Bacteroidota bacterium]
MKWLIIGFVVLMALTSQAQVLTPKHKAQLDAISDSTKKAKRLRRYLKKDSIRYQRKKAQLENQLKGVLRDSLKSIPGFEPLEQITTIDSSQVNKDLESLKQKGVDQLEQELPADVSVLPKDSAQLRSMALEKGKQVTLDKLDLEVPNVSLDSLNKQSTINTLEQEAQKRLKKELEGIEASPDLFSAQKAELENFRQQDQAKQQMKAKMANHAREFITKHSEKLQQVQGKMGELKRKYSYVPNSSDLSTARKRTSLEDEPFKSRLTLGGNFNISKTNPVMLDVSPVIGYRINTLFEAGFSVMYRSQLEVDRHGVKTGNDRTYGYSFYLRHMVFKNFFGYAEGENISRIEMAQDQSERSWTQTFLLGIGREFRIAKRLQFQTVVTYNFLHENRDGVYSSPVVFKTGFRIVK